MTKKREPLPTVFEDPRTPPTVEATIEESTRPDAAPAVLEAEVVPPATSAVPAASPEPGKQEAPKALEQKAAVQMDERGRQGALDLEQAFRLAKALFLGKGFPDWVKSPEQALAVSIYLKNLGLEVMTGIQHVCMVNGRMTLWGEGPLAAVRASGKLKSIKEGFYTADYKEVCFKNKNLDEEIHFAYCVTVRKDNGERKETWFSTKDAATANQGVTAIWKGYKRTMYKRKARAENLKDNFGDVLQGAGISEYDNESAPDLPTEASQRPSLAGQMEQKMIGGPGDAAVPTQ